jgi:hypothetical protein
MFLSVSGQEIYSIKYSAYGEGYLPGREPEKFFLFAFDFCVEKTARKRKVAGVR